MKIRDLYTARQLESLQQPAPDHRTLYQQTAESIADDCWSLDPAWLLDHPSFYEQIRTLDDKLTTMERMGANEGEYRATLGRLVECVRNARAAYEQDRKSTRLNSSHSQIS